MSNFQSTMTPNIGINIENNGSTKTSGPSSIAGNLIIKYQNLSGSVLFYKKIRSQQSLRILIQNIRICQTVTLQRLPSSSPAMGERSALRPPKNFVEELRQQ